jgi:Tol biopolymer transport system component
MALLLLLVLLGFSCSGGGQVEAPRFLIADGETLVEQAGGERNVIIRLPPGSELLDPAVSPDGRLLAFAVQQPAASRPGGGIDYGSDIYIANRDGTDQRLVIEHAALAEFLREPVWLPDGGGLLFTVRGQDALGNRRVGIERYDLASGERRLVFQDASKVDVGTDGSTVVYVHEDPLTQQEQLVVDGIESRTRRPLLPRQPSVALLTSPVLSPDGRQVAFAAADGPPRANLGARTFAAAAAHPTLQDVWLINVDGTDLRRLAEIVESQPTLAWSTDGASLYVLGVGGFWRIDPVSGAIESIGEGVPGGQMRLLP